MSKYIYISFEYLQSDYSLKENSKSFHRLKRFAESGLANYWVKKSMPKLDQCQLDNYAVASAEKRVLSLYDLMGPFLFLLAGISVSFLAFLIEIIVFKLRKHAQQRQVISA